MAGKPRLLSIEDAQFLTDVPRSLRIAYPGHKPCDGISADFQVSVETARGWLYRNAFPISRKVQFAQIVIARIDILDQEYGEIRKKIIKEFFSDGVHCWKAERGCCI